MGVLVLFMFSWIPPLPLGPGLGILSFSLMLSCHPVVMSYVSYYMHMLYIFFPFPFLLSLSLLCDVMIFLPKCTY
jgi:hypothetical protein